ncbi:sodium/potassium/calcium exchanger 1 [Striga asiatica]|uniref:Sodium/potassium/calcium exchanger 1 n=1 Tax=Striga asiatica TaxID=4170 RepID=A0A5A7QWG6_STRAF|nr:sodium/potassium/calcium exchanger 1 [Striga asiatica]
MDYPLVDKPDSPPPPQAASGPHARLPAQHDVAHLKKEEPHCMKQVSASPAKRPETEGEFEQERPQQGGGRRSQAAVGGGDDAELCYGRHWQSHDRDSLI